MTIVKMQATVHEDSADVGSINYLIAKRLKKTQTLKHSQSKTNTT